MCGVKRCGAVLSPAHDAVCPTVSTTVAPKLSATVCATAGARTCSVIAALLSHVMPILRFFFTPARTLSARQYRTPRSTGVGP
eukprot:3540679-Rhodomonas_salina.1